MKYVSVYCCITAVILTSFLTSAQNSCAVAGSQCFQTAGEDKDDPCSIYLAYLDCLRDVANNATLCPADYKKALDNQYKDLQSKGCSAFLNSSHASCTFAVYRCVQPSKTGEGKDDLCSKGRLTLDCIKNVVNDATLCSAGEITVSQEALDKAYKDLQSQGCSGSGTETLVSSLLFCLGLSGVAYILSALK